MALLLFRELMMDATDREHPQTTCTTATMRQKQSSNALEPADQEATTLSTAPAVSTGSTADTDPTDESGYGFGV
jgi:hypothetical protein